LLRILLILGIILAGTLIGTGIFAYFFLKEEPPASSVPLAAQEAVEESEEVVFNKRVSVLLIGTDLRTGETYFNSDVLIVASVDPDTRVISLLSIPRDTRVKVGSSNVKINAVPMYSSLERLEEMVQELTGIPLDGYILTNFDGFKEIVDTLNGVDIYVERDMYKMTGDMDADGVINLKEGWQHLNGSQALMYARFRDTETADIGRTARQQKVLKAIAAEALKSSVVTKLPQLIPQGLKAVETNVNIADLMKLGKVAIHFSDSSIVSQTLPGWPIYLNQISYWEVNQRVARLMGQNVLLGITTDRTTDYNAMTDMDPAVRYQIEQERLAAAAAAAEGDEGAEGEEGENGEGVYGEDGEGVYGEDGGGVYGENGEGAEGENSGGTVGENGEGAEGENGENTGNVSGDNTGNANSENASENNEPVDGTLDPNENNSNEADVPVGPL
jgi:LCP family protein required for cell wall assembly